MIRREDADDDDRSRDQLTLDPWVSQPDGNAVFSLRSMNVESKVVTTMATATGTDEFRSPRWSPDGKLIVLEQPDRASSVARYSLMRECLRPARAQRAIGRW